MWVKPPAIPPVCVYHVNPEEGAKAHVISPAKALRRLLSGDPQIHSRTISTVLRHRSTTMDLVDSFQTLRDLGVFTPIPDFLWPLTPPPLPAEAASCGACQFSLPECLSLSPKLAGREARQ